MADITEEENWDDGVYQLETTDPVEGGPDGVDNKPHKALANRTVWLKKQIETVQNSISNFSFAALAGSATQKFKVAKGMADDEAVNKKQLIDAITAIDNSEFVLNELKKYALSSHNHNTAYSKLGGSATQKFKVANAEADDEAVNFKQVTSLLGNIETVPSGIISMWSGLISAIPTGWFLCNGSNGTPDLRNKFVYGAASNAEVKTTGGSKDAVVVSHNHTANHNHGAYTNTAGNHSHTITNKLNGGYALIGSSFAGGNGGTSNQTIPAAGNHSHTVTVNNANVTTSMNGTSGTNKNLPPYMKLAYIMKG